EGDQPALVVALHAVPGDEEMRGVEVRQTAIGAADDREAAREQRSAVRLDEGGKAVPGDPIVLDVARQRALRPEEKRRPTRARVLAGGQVALEGAPCLARGTHVDGGELASHG